MLNRGPLGVDVKTETVGGIVVQHQAKGDKVAWRFGSDDGVFQDWVVSTWKRGDKEPVYLTIEGSRTQ